MYRTARTLALPQGQEIVVCYGGERYGWHAYRPQERTEPVHAATPAEAVAGYLGFAPSDLPASVREQSDGLLRELDAAPRYDCPCCGCRTLLNPDQYEICPVCGWEDDRFPYETDAEARDGPNRLSLREAQANYARLGVAKPEANGQTRRPQPEELPESM